MVKKCLDNVEKKKNIKGFSAKNKNQEHLNNVE